MLTKGTKVNYRFIANRLAPWTTEAALARRVEASDSGEGVVSSEIPGNEEYGGAYFVEIRPNCLIPLWADEMIPVENN